MDLGIPMSEPQVVTARTDEATRKAESIQQFRSLFQQHEPQLLAFADSLLNEFGRQSIASVTIFCPLDAYDATDRIYPEKSTW